ncbi:SusC/RagA family TonB-linked outer membrane protein [uncultured Rikenella sp.]|uniref:SusC/RagA family TonB-linked outer membrane protein n=4 Tax=uncultured Rikenella sp. TaxID=368003 RepID=UPI0026130A30|nr:SusC/RagA family TonB-linked outer membrane protein [uncultured Rikenella sp.]
MKKIRLLTLLILGLLVGGTAFAQSRVSGVVKSSEDGQPLAGVVVQIKGTTIGALTSADGSYTINNASVANSTLVFSYAGMRKQEIPVAGKSTINVTLQPDALQTEAVTVTALGGRKQNRSLGYATSTVKGDELARTNTLSPANALQGKVAGVQIAAGGSGGITTAPTVTIRGNKSLDKNNSPIYVIDGIIMEYAQQDAGRNFGNNENTAYGNQLKNLNPDDYESVTVLKGAAATALYGSRGANGAIVITTKSGKARKGIGVEVNYSHEWGQIYDFAAPLQNEYGVGWGGNGFEGGVIEGKDYTYGSYLNYSYGPSFASMKGQQVRQFYKYYAPDGIDNPAEAYVAYPDSWKIFYQNSNYDNVSVALTGGSEKATFRLSYGYMNGDGNMPKNSFDRHSINFTANGKINDIFSTNLTLQYSNSNTKNAAFTTGGAWATTVAMMAGGYYANRSTDLQWYKNHYINPETHQTYGTGSLSTINSWLKSQYDNNTNRNEQTIIAQLGLSAQFTDWLDANVSVSYNKWDVFTETKNAGYVSEGQYKVAGDHSGSYDGIAQLHSNNRFLDDNLELDVRVLGEVYGNTRSTSYSKSTRGGLITPGLFSFSNSAQALEVGNYSVGYTPRNSMTIGVAGVVNLSWKDQVYLEVTGRNDWLSSLMYPSWLPYGQNNYSVFYPSVNASWVFSDTFNIDPKILSFGKLRASWAQVGKGTSAYDTAKGGGGYKVESIYGPTNGNIMNASPNYSTLPNFDLKPEVQTSIEFGADLRFLNGMIGLDVAYYKTNTKNQILSLSAVDESGVTSQLINAGNIQNQGWEFQLDVTPIRTRTVNWNIGANLSRNRGKIKELANGINYYVISGYQWDGANGLQVTAFENGPFGVITAGNGYSYSNPIALYNNPDDPNDPRNGKRLIYYRGSLDDNTFQTANATQYGNGNAYTNSFYSYLTANNISGYYGENSEYWGGKDHITDILGRVEPDFTYGINTSVQVNLPNSSGSFDFYAQIDGRSGGNSIQPLIGTYLNSPGGLKATLYGRDKEHDGEARVNYKGAIEYNGIIPDAVFWESKNNSTVTSIKTGEEVYLGGMTYREAVDAGHIQPVLASAWYHYRGGSANFQVSSQSYMALRELTLGYNFPEKWIKHVGLQSARLAFTARNVCYIVNKMYNKSNPESFISNNALTPYDYSTTPFVRNFSVSLNLRF